MFLSKCTHSIHCNFNSSHTQTPKHQRLIVDNYLFIVNIANLTFETVLCRGAHYFEMTILQYGLMCVKHNRDVRPAPSLSNTNGISNDVPVPTIELTRMIYRAAV